MRIPNFADLRAERTECQQLGRRCGREGYAQGVHPNPRFFKYYWWVFWNESPVDGQEFLGDAFRLSSAAALRLIDELKAKNEPYWLYNEKVPRMDPTNPFDPQSPYWTGTEWAPQYDEDPDPIADGELRNHK
jgi:hypothetical protein